MKNFIVVLCLAAISLNAAAQSTEVQDATAKAVEALLSAPKEKADVQKVSYWKNSVQFDLGFSYTGLTSWAAGGYNTLVLNSGIDAKANYAKNLLKWDNRLQLQYGFLWSADKENLLQKSNDLIYLESSFGYKASKESAWNYSVAFDFRSQFSDSYDSYKLNEETNKWDGKLKSGFASPAYTNIALGMAWNPAYWFSANIAPLSGGFTICNIEELRQKYGMELRDPDGIAALQSSDPEYVIKGSDYKNARFQFGAQVKMNFKASINDNFTYETQLVLFTDYLNKPIEQTRVNWDNKFAFQIAKYFKIGLNTWMIYDPIVLIEGTQRVQFKKFFSINFTYLIKSK